MKTFLPILNAKELGIDTSRKFVVVNSNDFLKKGEIVTLKRDDDSFCPFFWNKDKSYYYSIPWDKLAYADKTWETLEEGDVLINSNNKEVEVLGICGRVIFKSSIDNKNIALSGRTVKELQELGWKIKGTDKTKLTKSEIEEKLNIKAGSLEIKE